MEFQNFSNNPLFYHPTQNYLLLYVNKTVKIAHSMIHKTLRDPTTVYSKGSFKFIKHHGSIQTITDGKRASIHHTP